MRSSTLSDQSGHISNARQACNNNHQVLTLAFYGQAEGTLGAAMCLILPRILQYSNSDGDVAPNMLGTDDGTGATGSPPRRMSTAYQCALRGRGWQRGQLNAERFMNESRLIGVPHRLHGCPARPYASRERSKYPLSPFTFT